MELAKSEAGDKLHDDNSEIIFLILHKTYDVTL